ncbi:amidohydrolase family protein [Roseateles cellulosilyticus]|uniref:Amidohydrolase family protein n=1 Tax=Pelomonas cellulosilytica TaxID=2906762 RepID=A0ABS8Y0W9_9BURK|nr:amidohydrolase family protein [Pelomonas sp. P8]MCE4557630.1 amidohydrolase family protein [Pelomonas sp. P8]
MRILTVFLLLACGLAQAQAPQPPYQASEPLSWELKNARWFDGRQIQRGNLYVENGVFVAKKPAKVNRKMDLRHQQVVIAPLAEAHNHNLQTAWGWGQYAQTYLDEGVFYAAMLCGDPAAVAEVKPLAATPAAPDVSFVTACITSSDGYPLAAVLPEPSPEAAAAQKQIVLVDSPAQAAEQWPAIKARGGQWLRLVLAHSERPDLRGQLEHFGRLGLTPETAAALTKLAHADGRRVVAHVETAADFDAALAAGVDAIAHLPGYANTLDEPPERFAISDDAVAQAARQHTAVITTTAATDLFRLEAAPLAALRDVQRANLAKLQAAGAPLLIGSDVFIGTARAELHALDALGMDHATLLRLATQDTPRALFPGRKLGCFEPGCEASFLLLAGDPLADLTQVDMPLLRVKQGRLLTRLADVAASSSQVSTSTADPPPQKGGKKKTGKAKSTGKPSSKAAAKPQSKAAGKAKPR